MHEYNKIGEIFRYQRSFFFQNRSFWRGGGYNKLKYLVKIENTEIIPHNNQYLESRVSSILEKLEFNQTSTQPRPKEILFRGDSQIEFVTNLRQLT